MESPHATYTTRFEQVAARFALIGCELQHLPSTGAGPYVRYIRPDGTASTKYFTELAAMRCALDELGVNL